MKPCSPNVWQREPGYETLGNSSADDAAGLGARDINRLFTGGVFHLQPHW